MGLDTPDGVMSLDEQGKELELKWSSRFSDAYFDEVKDTMRTVAHELEAEFQVDPIWYLHKTVITVHPVGGCSMGHSADDGVVDSYGEVFGHPGFVIADGSVMPGPVGPNPSLTIAALANRFAEHQIATA
jgi:cholesterol oxidase